MSLQESIDKVYQELMAMTPEEIRAELEKPVENGIGDLLVSAGVDLVSFLKTSNKKMQSDAGVDGCNVCGTRNLACRYCFHCGRKLRR